jgi:hypothetical protein
MGKLGKELKGEFLSLPPLSRLPAAAQPAFRPSPPRRGPRLAAQPARGLAGTRPSRHAAQRPAVSPQPARAARG